MNTGNHFLCIEIRCAHLTTSEGTSTVGVGGRGMGFSIF